MQFTVSGLQSKRIVCNNGKCIPLTIFGDHKIEIVEPEHQSMQFQTLA